MNKIKNLNHESTEMTKPTAVSYRCMSFALNHQDLWVCRPGF